MWQIVDQLPVGVWEPPIIKKLVYLERSYTKDNKQHHYVQV